MSTAELDAIQRLFYRAIVHPLGIDAFLAEADDETRRAFEATFDQTPDFDRRARMSVYADAYFWRLHGVLVDHFSLLAWLLGPTRFRNLATDYVLHRPSDDPDIRRFGARLPAFLRDHIEATLVPGIEELAAIEWAMVRALDIPQPAPMTLDDLAALPPEAWPELRLHAMPSAFVGPCRYAFSELWARHLDGAAIDAAPSPAAPGHVLVWRAGLEVMHRIVGAQEADALAQVAVGVAFAALCEGIDAPTAVGWLTQWIGDGLIAADPQRGRPQRDAASTASAPMSSSV